MRVVSTANGSDEQVLPKVTLGRFSWAQIVWFLIAWLTLFALGTLVIANPFWMERSASSTPDYSSIMYMHSLLVGMAGVAVLVACEIFQIRSQKVRVFILFASVVSTVLAGLGGIFDATLQINWFWLLLHVVGFFALDAIFIAFIVGLFQDLRARTAASRTLAFWAAIISAFSLEFAALMGHAAGWILDFGDHPALIGMWAKFVGEGVNDFSANLVTSHSHEIVAALLSLLVSMVAWRFGYQFLGSGAKLLARVGLLFVVAGTVIMTIMYVLGGFTSIEPPALFTFGPGGANGLASDDLVTGIGVMIGGLLVLLALLFKNKDLPVTSLWGRTTLYSIAASWLSLVVTVVGAGYYIELNETVFGAGSPAPGAVSDAVFTFAHQDYAFFLIPASIVLMFIANIVLRNKETVISRSIALGIVIAFIGILTYVFFDPMSVHGAGYVITAIGLFVIFVTVLVFLEGLWKVVFSQPYAENPPHQIFK